MSFRLPFTLASLLLMAAAQAASPESFAKAKRIAEQLFSQKPQTLYCQCTYYKDRTINLDSCNMTEASHLPRAHRLEWEHIVAVENFGRAFACWREFLCQDSQGKPFRGRKCCEKIDPKLRHMESELYNLWPAMGLVNQARSNYRHATVDNKHSFYGCAIAIDKARRRAEPPDDAKGIVARAYLFFSDYYKMRLSKSQRKLFYAWHHLYPPRQWEKDWASQVAQIEGYSNPYILLDNETNT